MFNMFNDINCLDTQEGVPPPYPPPTGIYILSDIKGLARRADTRDTHGKIPRF